MSIRGNLFINGEWLAGEAGTFHSYNPTSSEPHPQAFTAASLAQVDAACHAANAAANPFRETSPAERAAFLNCCADEIMALGDTLLQQITAETGYTSERGQVERARTCNQLNMFADHILQGDFFDARIESAQPERKPSPRPELRFANQALGPVAVFGASNFPLAYSVAGGDTASALAAGCPVVVKGHPSHPGTSELVAQAIARAVHKTGMPKGMFNYVIDAGIEAGCRLVKAPQIKAVGFTGSLKGGMALYHLANQRPEPIPVFAEMGSVNPVFLLPQALQANPKGIATNFVASLTLGTGQFCVNPGLVIAEKSASLDAFLQHASQQIAEVESGLMLNEQVCKNYHKGIEQFENLETVQLVEAGLPPQLGGYRGQTKLFKVSSQQFLLSPELQHEVFGPASLVVVCESVEEFNLIAQRLSGQLTASVHGAENELPQYTNLLSVLSTKAGRLVFNGFPTGVEVCHATVHGGPFPASTDSRFTSVGTAAIKRFLRPVCYQNCPDMLLPQALQDKNPWKIPRKLNGKLQTE